MVQPQRWPSRASETKLPLTVRPGGTRGTTPSTPSGPKWRYSHDRPGSTPSLTPSAPAPAAAASSPAPARNPLRESRVAPEASEDGVTTPVCRAVGYEMDNQVLAFDPARHFVEAGLCVTGNGQAGVRRLDLALRPDLAAGGRRGHSAVPRPG